MRRGISWWDSVVWGIMEKRLLQFVIVLAGFVPAIAGGAGVVLGTAAFGAYPGTGADSQMRYLSGLLMAIGLMYWGCVPAVERRGGAIRLLTFLVVVGGLARLVGVALDGDPGRIRWAFAMELGVAPLICLWQSRVAARGAAATWRTGRQRALSTPPM